MKLSVIIPAFNEVGTLGAVLHKVAAALPNVEKELVVVDDGSTDGTRDWIINNLNPPKVNGAEGADFAPDTANSAAPCSIRVLFHEKNQGKGAAIRNGLAVTTGDVFIIQDSDLEYDPGDWERMWPLIVEQGVADVVYGSRFYGLPHRSLNYHHFLANRFISVFFNVLYNQTLSDIEVCYKMFTRQVLESLHLTCDDFGFEVEFSAQVAKARCWRIYEVGIQYFGRTYSEGKKINWKDGLKAIWYILRFRFLNSGKS